MTLTVISFNVRVPVLSEQIIVVAPSVSIAFIFLTIAFLRASAWTPIARVRVTIIGIPSGIAETPSATEVINMSTIGIFLMNPRPNRIAMRTRIIRPIFLPRTSSWMVNGERVFSCFETSSTIFPNSVLIPVFITFPVALPAVTIVPL